MTFNETAVFLELVERIQPGAILRQAWHLAGGVSAQVTALEIESPGGEPVRLIVRRHGEVDRAANPHIARDEYRLLEIVRHHDVLAPKPVYLDESCNLFPTPLLVVEFVEGKTDAGPMNPNEFVERAAVELAKIHAIEDSPLLDFLPRMTDGTDRRPVTLDESMQEGRIREALTRFRPDAQVNPSVLLHGDYWPGNLLWLDERLAAVLDWEDAKVGDPLADIGNTRMEILFDLGDEAMEHFTAHYASLTGIDLSALPFWDLSATLRPCGKLAGWGLEPDVESRMRERHAWFVERAVDSLGRQ